jgi:hypothetical protein
MAYIMSKSDAILEGLRKQRSQLSQHPRLTSLNNLCNACIRSNEYIWQKENGIIEKSTTNPIDFKPFIDAVGEENVKNGETRKISYEIPGKCIDCEVDSEEIEDTRYIKINKLKWIVPEN